MMFAEERESVEGENQFTSYQDLLRRRGGWARRIRRREKLALILNWIFRLLNVGILAD